MKYVNKCLTSRKVGGGVGKVNNWFLLTGVSLKAILYMAFWRQYYETLSQSLFNMYCWLLFKTFVSWFLFHCFDRFHSYSGSRSYFPSSLSSFPTSFKVCSYFVPFSLHLLIGLPVESVDQAPSRSFKTAFSYQHGNDSKTFKTVLRFVKKHLQKVYKYYTR